MDPITGSILTGVISGGLGLVGAKSSDDASAKQANNQMDFQREMSNTAHQREVDDLRKAGLNPILSALGNGSSTPTGAMGQVTDKSGPISKGVDTAIGMRMQSKQMQQIDAGISNTQADTANKATQAGLMAAQTISANAEAKAKAIQTKQIESMLPSLVKKAQADGDYAELNNIMGLVSQGANSASSILDIGNQFGKALKLPTKLNKLVKP